MFRRMHVHAWPALVVVAVLSGCGTAAEPTVSTAAALQPCVVPGLAEAADCATVRVAESPGDPRGRSIDLRVVVLRAATDTPLGDPIVPLAGGPGQGAAELTAIFTPRFNGFRDRRDLVFVDQRGTGGSNPLHCAAPKATASLMGVLFDPERLAACRDELAARADLTKYTTSIAAADYEAVFDRLDYRQVDLIGTSYGSRLGLELTRRLPSRVRTLTIEAVVPTSFAWPSGAAPAMQAALDALADDCAADAACAQAFSGFRQDIEVAFARVRRNPVLVTVRDPDNAAVARVRFGTTDLAYATRGLLYGNDALSLPLWFRRAAEGDFTALAQAYVNRARALDEQIARGVHLGVYCAEDTPFVDWRAAEAAAEGTRIDRYLIEQYRRACEIWPRGAIGASFREPVVSNVPTLLMTGRRDPVTPPRTAIAAARTLTRSRVVVFPRGGHGNDGLASRSCRAGILQRFIDSADPAAIDAGCASQDPSLPFRLR
jgi:pimeloyl-ACP methyl ester carboxylesterase